MRYMIAIAMLALLGLTVSALADTETTKTANVTLTVDMYVAVTNLHPVELHVLQDGPITDPYAAIGFGNIGGTQTIDLWKNCDVDLTVAISDLAPNAALLQKEPTAAALPGAQVSINGERIDGKSITRTQQWVYCTENDGEQIPIDYWWSRNGLCDHTGVYNGTITVTAIGIDP